MAVPKGTLPTGRPNMLWTPHPEIKFFYATKSEKYIYFLYRSSVHVWRWEIWANVPKEETKSIIQHSEAKMQFMSAYSQANIWLGIYEHAAEHRNDPE